MTQTVDGLSDVLGAGRWDTLYPNAQGRRGTPDVPTVAAPTNLPNALSIQIPLPEAATTGASESTSGEKMTLLEHITLLDRIEYSPSHCAKCGHQNLEHLEMECSMYEQCIKCYNWGPKDFVKHHSCHTASEVSWGANADYYEEKWYQGHD